MKKLFLFLVIPLIACLPGPEPPPADGGAGGDGGSGGADGCVAEPGWHAEPNALGSWDWDCDGVEELRWTEHGSCDPVTCELVEGWSSPIGLAPCGLGARWVGDCVPFPGGMCGTEPGDRTQECR